MDSTKTIRAQRRVTDLLQKKGDSSDLNITPTLVLHWWRQLNLAIFQGMLRAPVKVHCRKFHNGDWGWCSPKRYKAGSNIYDKDVIIGIRKNLDDWYTFLTVLAHEMVHQYQWVYYGRMSHGKKQFYAWAKVLQETVGLPLHENTFPSGHHRE